MSQTTNPETQSDTPLEYILKIYGVKTKEELTNALIKNIMVGLKYWKE